MSDKKEILDYLRNRQKAAEIEAKVNGINLWVLLGAVGVISWQLLGYVQLDLWAHRELAVRVLLFAEAIVLLNWLCSPTRGIRDELRYSSWRAGEVESPLLTLAEGLWMLLPPVAHLAITGKNLSAVIVGFIGFGLSLLSVLAIVARLSTRKGTPERFPKPDFSLSSRSDASGDLIIGAGFVFAISTQAMELKDAVWPSSDLIKVIALLAALYLLLLVAIRRRRSAHSTQWTYELETDILVGAVSADAALRRIEHRALGPRFEDVMTRFFDDVEGKLSAFEKALGDSRGCLHSVKEVPEEYADERSARIQRAMEEPRRLLADMVKDMDELSNYRTALAKKKKSDGRVSAALDVLASRKVAYEERVAAAKKSLEATTREL